MHLELLLLEVGVEDILEVVQELLLVEHRVQ